MKADRARMAPSEICGEKTQLQVLVLDTNIVLHQIDLIAEDECINHVPQMQMAVVVKTVLGSHFGWFSVHHPFLSILVGIGMFTGGTIWVLTHGQMERSQGERGASIPAFDLWSKPADSSLEWVELLLSLCA